MHWLMEPFEADVVARAFVAGVIAACLCALVGCWVLLRRSVFLGDAMTHGMLPGVAVAALLGVSLMAGGLLAALAVVGISYVFVQGFLVRKVVPAFGEFKVITAGFLLSASMYVLLSFNTWGLFGYLGIIPHVIGWGCAAPALQSVASRQVPSNRQGLLQGALTGVSGLAAILGPAFSTATFSYFTSPIAPIDFPGAFFLVGAFVLVFSAWLGTRAGKAEIRREP